MSDELEVIITAVGFSTVVTVHGSLEFGNRAEFSEIVMPLALSENRLILDMSDVKFIDSLGISELVRLRRALQARGQGTHLVPSERVLASLKFASSMGVMNLYPDLETALLPGDRFEI